MSDMRKPETGGKPKKITTKNTPGGPATPGARSKSGKTIRELAKESTDENENGTSRSR